jgi:hypothetical protein
MMYRKKQAGESLQQNAAAAQIRWRLVTAQHAAEGDDFIRNDATAATRNVINEKRSI